MASLLAAAWAALLAVLLAYGVYASVRSPAAVDGAVAGLGLSTGFARLAMAVEAALVALLLGAPATGLRAAAAYLLVVTATFLAGRLAGREPQGCGCFGGGHDVGPAFFGRNGALIAVSLAAATAAPQPGVSPWLLAACLAAAAITLAWARARNEPAAEVPGAVANHVRSRTGL